jgi:hypothetical protein
MYRDGTVPPLFFMAFEYGHPGFSGKGFHLNDDFAPAL